MYEVTRTFANVAMGVEKPEGDVDHDEMISAYEAGELTDEDIHACAARIINIILQTNAYQEAVPYGMN